VTVTPVDRDMDHPEFAITIRQTVGNGSGEICGPVIYENQLIIRDMVFKLADDIQNHGFHDLFFVEKRYDKGEHHQIF